MCTGQGRVQISFFWKKTQPKPKPTTKQTNKKTPPHFHSQVKQLVQCFDTLLPSIHLSLDFCASADAIPTSEDKDGK